MYKKTFIVLVDQVMLSAINMIVAIMLIKFSSKAEYGEYSLAIAIVMFAYGLQYTLIHLPLTVTGNKIDAKDRTLFFTSLCILLYVILIPFTGVVAIVLYFFPGSLLLQTETCWALLFSLTGISTRELIRSLFFADLKVIRVLVVDTLYTVLFIILIGVLYFSQRLTASYILATMGVCSFIAAMIFVKSSVRGIWLRISLRTVFENIIYSWKDSKWMVVGMILSWIVNNGYLFLLAYLVSKDSVAELNGTRVLIAPLFIIMGAWGKIFLPKGALMTKEKQHLNILNIMVKSTIGLLAVAVCYIASIYLVSDYLAVSLYNNKYDNVGMYISLWGGVILANIISTNLQNLISIFSRFKELFFLGFVNSSLFLGYSYYLISRFEAVGAVSSLIIAKIILSLQYGHYYYTKRDTIVIG